MKATKSRNTILFILLMTGITLNILWSVRLELKAANVKSLVDEHHQWLKENKDILVGIQTFTRNVGNKGIHIDKNGLLLQAGNTKIMLDEHQGNINNGDTWFSWSNDSINFSIGKDNDFFIDLGTKNTIEIHKGKTLVKLGTDDSGLGDFVQLKVGDTKAIKILEEKGIGIGSFDDKPILLFAGPDRELGIKIDPDKKSIVMRTAENYGIGAGESGDLGKWVSLKLGDKKAITLAEKKGVGLVSDDKPVVIQGKKSLDMDFDGDINITAKGNINIRSDNGNVKINGKKILLNE